MTRNRKGCQAEGRVPTGPAWNSCGEQDAFVLGNQYEREGPRCEARKDDKQIT